ncbi:MAG: papain-like cysteine protease family protein [Alphaproteobacteria bacterium]
MRRGDAQLLLLALSLAGCAATPTPDVDAFAARSANNSFEVFHRSMNASALVLPVVQDQQTSTESCGAHALASVVNYWRGSGAASGDALFRTAPPQHPSEGYSVAEIVALAQSQGLLANAVRMDGVDITHELDSGRPVLVPVRAPAIYLEPRALPGANTPVVGAVSNVVVARAARVSEFVRSAMVDHYLVINGYEGDHFVVVDPVLGYRTISFAKLARYRHAFGNAAIVFSAQGSAARRS